MNGLEVFRNARPEVVSLDDATAAAIQDAVFGGARPARPPSQWRNVAVAAACVAGLAVGAWVVGSSRHSDQPTIAPATSGEVLSSSSVQPAATTSGLPQVDDWRQHPERRFQRSTEYSELYAAALDLVVGRCMTERGFEYRGNPYDTDGGVPATRTPGTYEAAYLGESDAAGGCLQLSIDQMLGSTRADEVANYKVVEMSGTWERTALSLPSMQARLSELASCVRSLGGEVRDSPERPNKVYDDVQRGIGSLVIADPRLQPVDVGTGMDTEEFRAEGAAERALYNQIADELCPGYSEFDADFEESIRLATVAWIEANPGEMASIQAAFDEDMARFTFIIEHDGEFPSS